MGLSPPTICCDSQLVLRPVRLEHAAQVFRIVDSERAYLGRWLPWVVHTRTVIPLKQFIRESIQLHQEGERFTWFIWYEEQIVGSLSINAIDKDHRSAEIGYWLSQYYQGRGIMTRSVAAVLDFGFNHLALNRVVIRTPADNQRSRAVAERLGFQFEGIMRQSLKLADGFHDLALYSCLRQEWEAAHNR